MILFSQLDLSENSFACSLVLFFEMRDKSFQKDMAVVFLRAMTPGDDSNKIDLFKKLSEKCASDGSYWSNYVTLRTNSEKTVILKTFYFSALQSPQRHRRMRQTKRRPLLSTNV